MTTLTTTSLGERLAYAQRAAEMSRDAVGGKLPSIARDLLTEALWAAIEPQGIDFGPEFERIVDQLVSGEQSFAHAAIVDLLRGFAFEIAECIERSDDVAATLSWAADLAWAVQLSDRVAAAAEEFPL